MDSYSVNFRIKKRWVRTTLIVLVTAMMVAPITAYAIDRFTDVPASNVFHNNITWLADAGVTLGCNPPANTQYCPDDNVTRGQMAAFLQRLAENQVVDAGALEGNTAADFLPKTVASVGSFAHGTGLGGIVAGAPFEATNLSISASTSGPLLVEAQTGWEGGDVWFTQWLEINEGAPCDNWNSTDRLQGSESEGSAASKGLDLNSQAILTVAAGTHNVSLCLWPFSSTVSSLNVGFSLIAQLLPPASTVSVAELASTSGVSTPQGGPSGQ